MSSFRSKISDIRFNDNVRITVGETQAYCGALGFVAMATCTEELMRLYQQLMPAEQSENRFGGAIEKYECSILRIGSIGCAPKQPIKGEYPIFKIANMTVSKCFVHPTVTICLGNSYALTTYADIDFIKGSIELIYRCCKDIPVFELLSVSFRDGPSLYMRGGYFPTTQAQLRVFHLFCDAATTDCKQKFEVYGAGSLDAEILHAMMPCDLSPIAAMEFYAKSSRELQRRVLAALINYIPYFAPTFVPMTCSPPAVPTALRTVFTPSDLEAKEEKEQPDVMMSIAQPICLRSIPVISNIKPLTIGQKSAFKKYGT